MIAETANDDRVKHCVQFRSGIQYDDQLGNSSAQRHFDTTITSVLSDNSSVAPIVLDVQLYRHEGRYCIDIMIESFFEKTNKQLDGVVS